MSDTPEPSGPTHAELLDIAGILADRIPRFASGGTIAPLVDDSDSVPALLERGCAYIIVRDEIGPET